MRGDTYRCFSCPDKGDVIHAAQVIWRESFLEAVKRLGGGSVGEGGEEFRKERAAKRLKDERDAEVKAAKTAEAIRRIQAATSEFRNEPDVLNYLTEERRLPLHLIRQAQDKKIIGFLPANPARATDLLVDAVGFDLLRESELWKPDAKLPGMAYRPLVSFLPGFSSAEFRLIGEIREGWQKSVRYGSLEYPYWWEGQEDQGLACEGWIDQVSAIALGFKGHVMALPGCNSMRIEWFLKATKKYGIRRWIIGLDNDLSREDGKNPGQEWAKKICDALTENSILNYNHPPECGDINDVLRSRFGRKGGRP